MARHRRPIVGIPTHSRHMAMSGLPLVAALLAVPLPARKHAHIAALASTATTVEGIGADVAD